MRYEIGSHFEYEHNTSPPEISIASWLPSLCDSQFTFSGRAAIELAIKDIEIEHKVNKVYMPSYCCKSMIDPFVENNIQVLYYEVYFEEGKGIQYNIDVNVDCDIFFAMSYFGLEEYQHDSILASFKARGTIIIEDITHRLLNAPPHSSHSDYTIASLRKWFPIASGGIVSKSDGQFKIFSNLDTNKVVKSKKMAMKLKREYLDGANIDKDSMLSDITVFEKEFSTRNYRYQMDDFSFEILKTLDIKLIKRKRRNNARILLNGIRDISSIEPLILNPLLESATPLFIPIMLEKDKRNSLRSYLIQHNVYCPVHWPNSKQTLSEISQYELSLICDQRYTQKDMDYIITLIHQWQSKLL